MQIDSCVSCECNEGCCSVFGSCAGGLGFLALRFFSTGIGRYVVVICKIIGLAFDVYNIYAFNEHYTVFICMCLFFGIDRFGALFMAMIYGCKPKSFVRGYAEGMEMAGKTPDREGIITLYIGSLFSVTDFQGQIWKCYTYAFEVDDEKVDDFEDKQIERAETMAGERHKPSTAKHQVINIDKKGREFVTGKNSVINICLFSIAYFGTIMTLSVILIIMVWYQESEGNGMTTVFTFWAMQTANACGLLEHYYMFGHGSITKCKGDARNCCCRCFGRLFCLIMVLIGLFLFGWVQYGVLHNIEFQKVN